MEVLGWKIRTVISHSLSLTIAILQIYIMCRFLLLLLLELITWIYVRTSLGIVQCSTHAHAGYFIVHVHVRTYVYYTYTYTTVRWAQSSQLCYVLRRIEDNESAMHCGSLLTRPSFICCRAATLHYLHMGTPIQNFCGDLHG